MSSNIPDPYTSPPDGPDGIDWARLEQEVTNGADVATELAAAQKTCQQTLDSLAS